jgi:hypothetical protein
MYEMQGPRVVTVRSRTDFSAHCPSGNRTALPDPAGFDARLAPGPWMPPGLESAVAVQNFYRFPSSPRKGFRRTIPRFFYQCSKIGSGVIFRPLEVRYHRLIR